MDTSPDSRVPWPRGWARGRRVVAAALATLLSTTVAGAPARADEHAQAADARVPPRLSYTHGDVSFWRPGAEAWAPAQVNTPLAPGDLLYVGQEGGLEVQVGPRAFVRAAAGTKLGLDNQEPDFLQFRLTGGHATLDLREVAPGHTVELATPNAVVTIERAGYYRAVVTEEATTLIARRSGQAMVTAASGEATAVASGTQVVVSGDDTAVSLVAAPAPELDAWDHWNYERTGAVLSAQSTKYVPPGVYGVDELDRHGTWRVEPEYGPVWAPAGVAAGWAPYSTGSWMWDPYYGWTWVDTAPWGWAPYHYGRWVYVRGHWAWAPGPFVTRPVYAPALVAFFGVGVRGPLGWCALGWGEPLLPWWGRPGFVGTPWWAGWGGPRVVNRVVVHKSVVVKAEHVTVFQNVRVKNAVVVVDRDRFGHGPVRRAHVRDQDLRALRPVKGDLAVQPRPSSLVATPGPATRPPDRLLERGVVATRRPAERAARVPEQAARPVTEAPARIVPAPPRGRAAQESLQPRPERREGLERRTPEPGIARPEPPRDDASPQSPRGPRALEERQRVITPPAEPQRDVPPEPRQRAIAPPEAPQRGAAPEPRQRVIAPPEPPQRGAAPEPRQRVIAPPEPPQRGPAPEPRQRMNTPPEAPQRGPAPEPQQRVIPPPEPPQRGAAPEPRQRVIAPPEPPQRGPAPEPRQRMNTLPEAPQRGPAPEPQQRVIPPPEPPQRGPAPQRGAAPAAPPARQPEPARRSESQPEPTAERPEQQQRLRQELQRPPPTRREIESAPGRRGLQAPAAPAPARGQPQSAPGARWRGASDHEDQRLRSRPEGAVRQPSPAIRQQWPEGVRQPGPAMRPQRSNPVPARQR